MKGSAMARAVARAWICGLVLALAPALAVADTAPLSALPAKPVRYAQATGPVPVTVTSFETRIGPATRVSATRSACVVYDPPKYWIDGNADFARRYPDLEVGDPTPFGIERLVERGDTAELERVTASVIYGELVPIARSRIALHPVAKLDGLTVYAYRWGASINLVTRSSGASIVRSDGGEGPEELIGCGIVATTLRLRDGASQLVQIRGTVPGTGKSYVVDASAAQTGRDPEPLLSVAARLRGR